MKKPTLILLVALVAASCGNGSAGVELSDARVSEPAGPNAAMYFKATSDEGDRLLSASTEEAAAVELHETQMTDGVMSMTSVDSLEVPAGGELVLEPGGFHLMLIDAEPFAEGSEIEVTLVWENAGEQTYSVEVVAPGDTMEHDH